MLKRVQDNISKATNQPKEEESKEFKAPISQTMGQVNNLLRAVQKNLSQTNVSDILKNADSIKEALKPLQEKVQTNLSNDLIQTLNDKIPFSIVKTIQEQLPQSTLAEMITSATKNFNERDQGDKSAAGSQEKVEGQPNEATSVN